MRAKSAELVALLQAGEQDYAWEYESVAQAAGLRYITLPAQIDLSAPDTTLYVSASVRVLGAAPGDTITVIGRPIRYAVSIPTDAPNHDTAQRFIAWLLSANGRSVLRSESLDALEEPQFTGSGVPHAVRFPN